ncbi:MAG: C4-type zinc ribbon domain-containing protein [Phycisphaerae bacterium]
MAQTLLDTLRELQEADQRLRALEQQKAAHDRSAKVQAQQIQKHQEALQACREREKAARRAADAKELEVRSKREEIERLRQQQMQVKDNRQYQALQNEIKFAELAITKIEDDILNDYAEIEEIQKETQRAEQELAAEQQRLDAFRQKVESKKAEVDEEIEACRRHRQEVADGLPPKVVDQFQRIADRFEGEALAPVLREEGGGDFVCGGCHMTVTQNTYVLLAGRGNAEDDLLTCPNCQRILYLED